MGFIYETHLHTCQGSLCAKSRGRDYIDLYKKLGYSGIMVTDHFYNSNTRVPRSLSWADWVNEFCAGFEEARREGERAGLDVFFGWEETFDDDDYLVYGMDREWLLNHPEIVHWTREEQFHEVHKHGGCVVHAHPFRQHYYIREIHLAPLLVDGIEAANTGNHDPAYDGFAMEYARLLKLPALAGSDIHRAGEYGPWGVELDEKLSSIKDYVRLILNKAEIKLAIPKGRCEYHEKDGARPFNLKVDIRDRKGRPTGVSKYMNFHEVVKRIQNCEKPRTEDAKKKHAKAV